MIGGIGNVRGAVLGGFVIAFVEQFGSFYISSNYRDVYVFALLIVILLVKPTGLFGSPCRRRCDGGKPSRLEQRALWPRACWNTRGRSGIADRGGDSIRAAGRGRTRTTRGSSIDIGIAMIMAVSLNIVNG